MSNEEPPVEQCDVLDKASLAGYRAKRAIWWRWLRTDVHHAIWPQIYAMLLDDITFRTLGAAAEADKSSALHSPILARGLVQGYAAMQGLSIRRLVDTTKGVISLRRLLRDVRQHLRLITREVYVSGTGLPYDADEALQQHLETQPRGAMWVAGAGPMAFAPSYIAHNTFDRLSGLLPERRRRTDRIRTQVIQTIDSWLTADEVCDLVDWSNMTVAHAADQSAHPRVNLAGLVPTFDKVAMAQRQLVRGAEAITAYLLHGPIHGEIIPVLQYNQFSRLDQVFRDEHALAKAKQRWSELAKDRNAWTSGVFDALVI